MSLSFLERVLSAIKKDADPRRDDVNVAAEVEPGQPRFTTHSVAVHPLLLG
jgi:hypothetical protein